MEIRASVIHGSTVNVGPNTTFSNTLFEDPDGTFRAYTLVTVTQPKVRFDNCSIIANKVKACWLHCTAKTKHEAIQTKGLRITLRHSGVVNKDFQILFAGTWQQGTLIQEEFDTPPADGYFIHLANGLNWFDADCWDTGPKTRWLHWSETRGWIGSAIK